MSGFVGRAASRAMQAAGLTTPPPPLAPATDLAGTTSVSSSSEPPGGSADVLPPPTLSSTVVTRAFTADTALPGVSEDTLRDLLDESPASASERTIAVTGNQLADLAKVLIRAHSHPPGMMDAAYWRRLDAARSVSDVVAATADTPLARPDAEEEAGRLRARLETAHLAQVASHKALMKETNLRENAEVFARQATAETEELKKQVKIATETGTAYYQRALDVQASLDVHTENMSKLQALLEASEDSVRRLRKQLAKEREVFKASLSANTSRVNKLARLLSRLVAGDSSDVQALRTKEEVQAGRIQRLRRANAILREHVSLQSLDPDTLVLAVEGIASGDLQLEALDLDQETLDILDQLRRRDVAAGSSTPLEMLVAEAVHHAKNPGKRRRLRQSVSDCDDDEEEFEGSFGASQASVGSNDGPLSSGEDSSARFAAAGLADVPGVSSEPSPSRRRRLMKPKHWKKRSDRSRPRKKRRSSSGPVSTTPAVSARQLRSGAESTGSEVPRESSSGDASASGGPAPGPQARDEASSQAASSAVPLSASDAREATRSAVSSPPASSTAPRASVPLRTTAPGRDRPLPTFSDPPSSSARRGLPRRQVAERGEFKTSLLVEQEAASDSEVLGGGVDDSPVAGSRSAVVDLTCGALDTASVAGSAGRESSDGEASPISQATSAVAQPADRSLAVLSSGVVFRGAFAPGGVPSRTVRPEVSLSDGSATTRPALPTSAAGDSPPVVGSSGSPPPTASGGVLLPAPAGGVVSGIGASGASSAAAPSGASTGAASGEIPVAATTPSTRSTRRRPGMQLVATFARGANPRGATPTAEFPVPPPGPRPMIPAQAKFPSALLPFVDLEFDKPAADRCWSRTLCSRLPTPIAANAIAPCSPEGINAFANFRDPVHPYQALLRLLPDRASVFDSLQHDLNQAISRRAPIPLRYFHLWRSLRGVDAQGDLGFALWERHHWIPQACVENGLRAYASNPSHDPSVLHNRTDAWVRYFAARKKRADNLRVHVKRTFWSDWLLGDQEKPQEERVLVPELIFEPSVPVMSMENLSWLPGSDDWVSEVSALDRDQPWRDCWMTRPEIHPFNTIFLPCNPTVYVFVPHGSTPATVGEQIDIDPEVLPSEVAANWDHDFADIRVARAQRAGTIVASGEERGGDGEGSASGDLSLLASAAASSSGWS